jgi:hypothetical protein
LQPDKIASGVSRIKWFNLGCDPELTDKENFLNLKRKMAGWLKKRNYALDACVTVQAYVIEE